MTNGCISCTISFIMPAAIPADVSRRNDLKDSVQYAVKLNKSLELVIAVKVRQPGVFHGKVSHSPPPWYAPVANAVLDLHALARKLESGLRYELGLPQRKRGGSSGNTVRALEAIPRLCVSTDDFSVILCDKELHKWASRAETALGVKEMPRRLPRPPGSPEPPCPFCKNHTLRMHPYDLDGKGHIRCVNPACRDGNGSRTTADLEFFHGEMVLRWSDGIIGTP